MRKKTVFIVVTIAVLFTLYSCTKDRTKLPTLVNCSSVNATTNTYNLNIQPNILVYYCALSGCHGGGGTLQDGVDFSSYSGTVAAFEAKNVICSLKDAGCPLMPNTGRPLADSLILQMQCWQQNGYPQ